MAFSEKWKEKRGGGREMGTISESLSMVVHVAHCTTLGTIHFYMNLYFINLNKE